MDGSPGTLNLPTHVKRSWAHSVPQPCPKHPHRAVLFLLPPYWGALEKACKGAQQEGD